MLRKCACYRSMSRRKLKVKTVGEMVAGGRNQPAEAD